ncbi:VOC family protein [Alteromonas gracilis]|uniref:VOC family protein n=1 Tax=Alteromonas gracilis TaxID=1479524 RepID=UPI0030D2B17E
MELGLFSLSLSVSDIKVSKAFYEALGFEAMPSCGSIEDKWLIMKNGQTMIGLFEGMFEDNILTFNPSDVRAVQDRLIDNGVSIDVPVKGNSGPGHLIVKDPDGNAIMFDQF